MSFFAELRRRKVFRVSIAYIVATWALLQIFDVVSPILSLPAWVPRLVLVLLAVGFVPAVILAWAVELTPEGPKQEKANNLFVFVAVRKLDFIVISILVLAVALLLRDRFAPEPPPALARSIAVLPFINMSSDPEQEFFSEGITEEILNSLAAIKELKVVGRTSSFAFKNQNLDLRKIGEMLGVEHILEGSVRKSGDKLRISAQLIQVHDGFNLWSASYDRDLTDIFAIQDDIANQILNQLKAKLLGDELEIVESARTNTEVFELYLRGRYALNRRGVDSLERAAASFERSIELDPNYGPAYLGLANAYLLLPSYTAERTEAMYESAIEIINRGVESDPSIADEADAVYGYIYNKRGDWLAADHAFQSALNSGNGESTTRQWYSQMLSSVGRLQDALEQARQAEKIDPLSPVVISRLAIASLWANDNQAAASQFAAAQEQGIEGQLNAESHLLLMIRLGRLEEARAAARALDPFPGDDAAWFEYLLDCLGKKERCAEAETNLASAQNLPPRVQLIAWSLLGKTEMVKQIARLLETDMGAFETELLFSAELKALRQDPEFARLVKTLGFTAYWQQSDCRPSEAGVICGKI